MTGLWAKGAKRWEQKFQVKLDDFGTRAEAVAFVVKVGEDLAAGRVALDKTALAKLKKDMLANIPKQKVVRKRPASAMSAACNTDGEGEPKPGDTPSSSSKAGAATAPTGTTTPPATRPAAEESDAEKWNDEQNTSEVVALIPPTIEEIVDQKFNGITW
jgi:hypothetical protein